MLNDGKQTDTIILDFATAFDKVSHKHLCTINYITYYGIHDSTVNTSLD